MPENRTETAPIEATRYVTLEPNWPTLLLFFEKAAREHKGAKRKMFEQQAREIRAYLEANPDKAGA